MFHFQNDKNVGVPRWLSHLCLTLDFGSGHDLTVQEIEPHVRLRAAMVESAWDSFSLSLCPSPTSFSLSFSLKINKLNKNNTNKKIKMIQVLRSI